ncbi:MAG: lipoate--protein ligase family protein [Planctomycetota bacterium]|nr:lipoate--protein ligase family protein [Planctomycetota bacterium]MDA1177318.1 lipoate--protein ligase family protein [Planctomycetota bacterium]
MHWVEATYKTLAENVAFDEILLNYLEHNADANQRSPGGILRLWEMDTPGVVLGRASRADQEVDLATCQRDQVPVVRRVSGGCTVMTGPGCLMYTLAMRKAAAPELTSPDRAHRWILDRMVRALSTPALRVERCGTSDLALSGRKFSGNSMRIQRQSVLYHGTLLYNFEIPTLDRYLPMPPREPEYRQKRSHSDFVCNFPNGGKEIRDKVRAIWNCHNPFEFSFDAELKQLVNERYTQDDWNRQW